MVNTIQIKRSNVAAKVPTAASLEVGELAVNFPDKKIFTKEPGGTVIELVGDAAQKSTTNTFTQNQVIDVTDNTNPALRVTQKGTGVALRVEDEANPDATPFVIDANGNVGIGTPTPAASLDIILPAPAERLLFLENVGVSTISSNKKDLSGNAPLAIGASAFEFKAYNGAVISSVVIDTNGSMGVGTLSPDVVKFRVKSPNPLSSNYTVFFENPTQAMFWIRNDGLINTGTTTSSPYTVADASPANLVVQSNGNLARSTSSIKYKKDVEPLDPALTDRAIAGLKPIWYRSKNPSGDDKAEWSHLGLIAEEVAKVEPRLVSFKTMEVSQDDDGKPVITELDNPIPEGVDYARLSVLLLAKVQQLETRLAKLEARS